MTPYDALADVADRLRDCIEAGRPVPVDLAEVMRASLLETAEHVAGLEASWRALTLLQGARLAPLPTIAGVHERQVAAWEAAGVVVRFPGAFRPHRPAHMSGCFRFDDGRRS